MTAIDRYQKLEVTGLWRAGAEAQRREVIVVLGEASLTLRDTSDRVLTHWSLAAIDRGVTDEALAIYHPAGDPSETLEFAEEATEMVAAIDRIRADIVARQPHPGRLRRVITGLGIAAVVVAAAIWLPPALVRYTAQVLPETQRMQLGEALLTDLSTLAGPHCQDPEGQVALSRLSQRVLGAPDRLVVLANLDQDTTHLPGGRILLGHGLLSAWDAPEVAAGFVLAEAERQATGDITLELIETIGPMGALRLLTSGTLRDEHRAPFAAALVQTPPREVAANGLAGRFAAREISAKPYARAAGATELQARDPFPGGGRPVLSDTDWVRLQGICGG